MCCLLKADNHMLQLFATSVDASVMQRIYIALPEEKARAHMFKVHLGDTPHDLSPQDYEELARHTEGFSGSDVAVVVKDVLMEPVRLTQDAGYFRLDLAADADGANTYMYSFMKM